jgi:hypothetical protein
MAETTTNAANKLFFNVMCEILAISVSRRTPVLPVRPLGANTGLGYQHDCIIQVSWEKLSGAVRGEV